MPSSRPRAGPGVRALARHVGRLRQSLDALGDRLRGAVAEAVARSAAAAAREAVGALLAGRGTGAVNYTDPYPARPASLWGRGHGADDHYEMYGGSYPPEADDFDHLDDADHHQEPQSPSPRRSRWPAALAVGLRAAAGVLGRRVGTRPAWAALAAGATAAALAFVGGPLAAAGLGLAGSALGLLALADGLGHGADALGALNDF